MTIVRGFGWRKDPHDERDRPFGARRPADVPRASEALGMVELYGSIRDQGMTSRCVGYSTAKAIRVRLALDGHPQVELSANGAYWGARAPDGFAGEDGGAFIRSGIRYARACGIPTEASWPSRLDTINVEPDETAEIAGLAFADGSYERIYSADGAEQAELVLDALQASCPVLFGTDLTAQFVRHVGRDVVPAPRPGDTSEGGHALLALGFDQGGARVCVPNSWGTSAGDRGWYWLDPGWFASARTQDIWALRPKAVTA